MQKSIFQPPHYWLVLRDRHSPSPTENQTTPWTFRRLLPQSTPPLTTSVVSQLAGRWPWSTGVRVDNTRHVAALTAGNEARYRLRIAIFAYPTCIRRPHLGGSRRNIAMPFGAETLEWLGYPVVKTF